MVVKRLLAAVFCVLAAGSLSPGTPFYVGWEGNTYPEQSGWTRNTRAGGAQRTLSDGLLFLDGTASLYIVDDYGRSLPSFPGPTEVFTMQWRMRVDEVEPNYDPVVCLSVPSGHGNVKFYYCEDRIKLPLEDWAWVPFQPGVFHEFLFTSTDMTTYKLYIDGQLSHTGPFLFYASFSEVYWGDAIEGGASASVWDYFRFGIVGGSAPGGEKVTNITDHPGAVSAPEPSSGVTFGLAALAVSLARVRRSKPGR